MNARNVCKVGVSVHIILAVSDGCLTLAPPTLFERNQPTFKQFEGPISSHFSIPCSPMIGAIYRRKYLLKYRQF